MVSKEWTAKVSAFCDEYVIVLCSWNSDKHDLYSSNAIYRHLDNHTYLRLKQATKMKLGF